MSKYDKQFKEKVVILAKEIRSRKAVKQLGIPFYTLVQRVGILSQPENLRKSPSPQTSSSQYRRNHRQYPDNDNYGTRRMHLGFIQEGEIVSCSTVYRLMKENGLLGKAKRHLNGIKREDATAQKSEGLIDLRYAEQGMAFGYPSCAVTASYMWRGHGLLRQKKSWDSEA